LNPPAVTRCPLRLTGADPIGEVAGRVYQTEVWLADWRVGEVAF